MSARTLKELMAEADSLSLDEQLRLAAYLVERVRAEHAPRRKWREIRGLAAPSLLGEDAQAWVSRTRGEADEYRERHRQTLAFAGSWRDMPDEAFSDFMSDIAGLEAENWAEEEES